MKTIIAKLLVILLLTAIPYAAVYLIGGLLYVVMHPQVIVESIQGWYFWFTNSLSAPISSLPAWVLLGLFLRRK